MKRGHEEARRGKDRHKDEQLAMLAHELRNPLAPIRTATAIVRGRAGDDPLLQRCSDVLERQVGHMARLLDDLLDVSRLRRGAFQLRRTTVSVRAVMEAAVETSRPLLDGRAQTLVTDGVDDLYVDADAARLVQVFGNLLNNAAKFSRAAGRIIVAAHAEGRDAVVTVRDSGVGMSPELIGHCFELFTQGDESAGRAHGGLGIGLALARRLVALHGGTITAASEGLGRGSTMTVRLPRVAATPPSAAPTASADAGAQGATPVRVLVADCHRDAADLMALWLEQLGCDVRTVYGGEAAVREAARFAPTLALLDLRSPREGHEACRLMRKQPGGEAMQIVAVTAWCHEHDRRTSTAAGFDRHLVKPVAPEALVELLHACPAPGRPPSHLRP